MTTVDESKKFIRLIKNTGKHWPYFTHPEYPDTEMEMSGAFHVRWPDGTVSIAEVQSKNVNLLIDGKPGKSGVFQYFEREYNGLELMYELHEVDLLEEEVGRCLIDPSQAVAAV